MTERYNCLNFDYSATENPDAQPCMYPCRGPCYYIDNNDNFEAGDAQQSMDV